MNLRSHLWLVTFGAVSLVGALCSSQNLAAAPVVEEAGGSVYVAFDLHPDELKGTKTWADNRVFHHPICQFRVGQTTIKRDMMEMFAHGQRKIATNLWHTGLREGIDCAGFLLNSRSGRFAPQVLDNLRQFVSLAGSIGFNEVQLRFAPLSVNAPATWKEWNETVFQENLSVILTTIDALHSVGGPKVMFDLGGELGGMVRIPFMRTYVQRTWIAALKHTDVDHTDGFSIAYAPGKIAQYVQSLREVGPVPRELSLTIYRNPYSQMSAAAQEAQAAGYSPPRFMIQETYYHDPSEYEEFVRAARNQRTIIRTIMQWPVVPDRKTNISEATTPLYDYGAGG